MQIAGPAHRTFRGIGRRYVYLHSGAAERPNGSECAVMKGVPVDPQQNRGDPGVESEHGEILSIRSPMRAMGTPKGLGARLAQ